MPKRKAAEEPEPPEACAARLVAAVEGLGGSFTGLGAEVRKAPSGLGLGLFAARQLQAGDVLAVLPAAACLSSEAALGSPLADAVRAAGLRVCAAEAADAVTPRSLLLLYLLAARHGTCDALPPAHAAYARSLPDRFSLPLLWPVEVQARELGGTELLREAQLQRVALSAQHARLFPRLSRARPDLFPRRHFSLDAFLWAHAAVASRAFPASSLAAGAAGGEAEAAADAEADGVLLPLLDIANHDPAGGDLLWQPHGPAASGPAFAVVAARPVAAGQQLLGCYGGKSGASLLLHFGFCQWDPPAPLARLPLRIGAVFPDADDARARAAKAALFRALSGCGLALEVELRGAAPLPPRLLAAARVCALTPAEAAAAEGVCALTTAAEAAAGRGREGDPGLEKRALAVVAGLLQRRREQLLCGAGAAEWGARAAAARAADCVAVRGAEFAVTPAGAAAAYREGALRLLDAALLLCVPE